MQFTRSLELFQRATRVIPCGIYGHVSPAASLPLTSPYYAYRASGCRYWDLDGNQFIDYMCGYGPIVLGYQNSEVDEAAENQRRAGDCFNHPTHVAVELAEKLTALVDGADWAVFGKNGGDMTSWAIRVAREHTGRKKILKVKGAYHGVDPWCAQMPGGVIDEDVAHIHSFSWNDPEALLDLVKAHANTIAGVILTPFHHPSFGDCEAPSETFVRTINETCQQHGIVQIMDDIRGGFRVSLKGTHTHYGWKPDLICQCKAMGNGYPISATLGSDALKLSASRVFLTGSYWNGAVAMAACLKTIEILERENLIAYMAEIGTQLREGLLAVAERHGIPLKASGPPAVPFYRIADETNFQRQQHWCAAAMAGRDGLGAFFHPHHNWFLCAAHKPHDIEATLHIADHAFSQLAEAANA